MKTMYKVPRPKTAKPATPRPITVPPVKDTFKACAKEVRAACVVRTFALVAMFMPIQPAKALKKAPMTKATAINQSVCAATGQFGRPAQQGSRQNHKYAQYFPFGAQEGQSTFRDVASQFNHVGVARILLADPDGLNDHNG